MRTGPSWQQVEVNPSAGPSAPVVEPAPGAAVFPTLDFVVSCATPPAGPVQVRVEDTGDGTATAETDYRFEDREVVLRPDEPEAVVRVDVLNDPETDEPPETVRLRITDPTAGAVLGQAEAEGTIIDYCDSLPPLAFDAALRADVDRYPFGQRQVRAPASRGAREGRVTVRLPPLDVETVCDPGNLRYDVSFQGSTFAQDLFTVRRQFALGPHRARALRPRREFSIAVAQGSQPPPAGSVEISRWEIVVVNLVSGERTPAVQGIVRWTWE